MYKEHRELVINAIKEIFHEINIKIDKIDIINNLNDNNQIIGNIGITGTIKGNFVILSNLKSAKNITGLMLNKSSIAHDKNKFNNMYKAVFGELANQLSARVSMYFSENNIDCSITPPTIITGNSVKTLIYGLTEFFYSNIIGQFGYINLLFGIK